MHDNENRPALDLSVSANLLSDEQLMERHQQVGHETQSEVITELHRRHARKLLGFCQRYCPGHGEDIAQNTWSYVLKYAHQYEPRYRFINWLYMIAVQYAQKAERNASEREAIVA